MLMGHSSMSGAATCFAGRAVNPSSANLSCSAPDQTPARSTFSSCAARGMLTTNSRAAQLEKVDLAGVWSGAEHDKFKELGFTARPATLVAAPLIEECPINIECIVRHQLALGAHDLYLAEIVATHYDEKLIDSRGRLKTAELDAMAYVDGEYWSLGERLGSYGQAAKALQAEKK